MSRYPTARSRREVLAVFAQEGMDVGRIEQMLATASLDSELGFEVELNDTEAIYERCCSICSQSFEVTAAMQAASAPDSPLNICDSCNQRLIDQSEARSVAELSEHFQLGGLF